MRLQNIIDSIRPAVMAKVEAVIAKHEKTISDKEADITDKKIMIYYTEGALLLQLESPLRLIEPSGLCEAANIMSEQRRNCSDNSLQDLQRMYNTSLSRLMGDYL